MNKLLVICGPTATGKTSLAIKLAKKFNGEIISADSRQVYKGMDIGTGKEWGKDIKIWGYDLVDPKHEFSVSQYLKFACKIIRDVKKRKHLPILVGGTGLYIKGVIDGIPTVLVPQNKPLRESLREKRVNELFEILSNLDSLKSGSMNNSDKNNPRRLIRAIEVSQFNITHGQLPTHRCIDPQTNLLFVGLMASSRFLHERINQRVDERVTGGMKNEMRTLLRNGVNWESQSMFSLGYRQYRDFFEGAVDEKTVIFEWKKEERKYSKRQMTWFKKDERVNWFDITQKEYPENVEILIKKWYKLRDAKKD